MGIPKQNLYLKKFILVYVYNLCCWTKNLELSRSMSYHTKTLYTEQGDENVRKTGNSFASNILVQPFRPSLWKKLGFPFVFTRAPRYYSIFHFRSPRGMSLLNVHDVFDIIQFSPFNLYKVPSYLYYFFVFIDSCKFTISYSPLPLLEQILFHRQRSKIK